jgi:hypothetical protein
MMAMAMADRASSSRVAASQTSDEGPKNCHDAIDNDGEYAGDTVYDDHDAVADS